MKSLKLPWLPIAQNAASLNSVPAETVEVRRRQVIEVELPKCWVREYRAETVICPGCGAVVAASFPAGVNAPVQYGKSVQSLVVYLSVWQMLPCHRLSELMGEFFGCPMSPGSVVNMLRRAGANSAGVVATIRERILKEPWTSFDETGLSLAGLIHWLHTASTPVSYTHLSLWKRSVASWGSSSGGEPPQRRTRPTL